MDDTKATVTHQHRLMHKGKQDTTTHRGRVQSGGQMRTHHWSIFSFRSLIHHDFILSAAQFALQMLLLNIFFTVQQRTKSHLLALLQTTRFLFGLLLNVNIFWPFWPNSLSQLTAEPLSKRNRCVSAAISKHREKNLLPTSHLTDLL